MRPVRPANATSRAFPNVQKYCAEREENTIFQFRCYRCGKVFNQGLPPLEALSDVQATIVGDGGAPSISHSVLRGTQFEGMSPYNFCEFCLVVINDYPSALVVDWPGDIDVPSNVDINPYKNRWSMLQQAAKIYRDISMLSDLLLVGIEQMRVNCLVTGCDEYIMSSYQTKYSCAVHTFRRLTSTEVALFITADHDVACNCDLCGELAADLWASLAEAYHEGDRTRYYCGHCAEDVYDITQRGVYTCNSIDVRLVCKTCGTDITVIEEEGGE